jgi:hypothetical protein
MSRKQFLATAAGAVAFAADTELSAAPMTVCAPSPGHCTDADSPAHLG